MKSIRIDIREWRLRKALEQSIICTIVAEQYFSVKTKSEKENEIHIINMIYKNRKKNNCKTRFSFAIRAVSYKIAYFIQT